MIIECPECATRFQGSEALAQGRPRKVRCAKCAHVWTFDPATAQSDGESPVSAAASASAPAEEAPIGQMASFEEPAAQSAPAMTAREQFADVLKASAPRAALVGEPIPGLPGAPSLAGRIAALVLAAIVLLGVVAFAIQYRVELVRSFPQLGALYGLVGVKGPEADLEIRKTHWSIEERDGVPILTVRGEIHNSGAQETAVPRVRLAVRDAKGHELYHWSVVVDPKRLGPGDSGRFTARLPSPPPEADDVEISFEHAAD